MVRPAAGRGTAKDSAAAPEDEDPVVEKVIGLFPNRENPGTDL